MIRAEHAERILKRYEEDYDNFLGKLKAKRDAKKQQAVQAKAEALKADKTVAQAEAYKKTHLKEKAKGLLDKVGGIEGAAGTVQNVIKYFKTDTPSDYQVSVGGPADAPAPEKKILGLPPVAVYTGGTVLGLLALFGLSPLMKNKQPAPVQVLQTT